MPKSCTGQKVPLQSVSYMLLRKLVNSVYSSIQSCRRCALYILYTWIVIRLTHYELCDDFSSYNFWHHTLCDFKVVYCLLLVYWPRWGRTPEVITWTIDHANCAHTGCRTRSVVLCAPEWPLPLCQLPPYIADMSTCNCRSKVSIGSFVNMVTGLFALCTFRPNAGRFAS